MIAEQDFDFLFLYFGIVDQSGHDFGWGSETYEKEVGNIDQSIGRVINALKKKNIFESTYIFLTADHGGQPGEFNHGKQEDSNLFVPFYIIGPNIKVNHEIKSNVHNMDMSPSI